MGRAALEGAAVISVSDALCVVLFCFVQSPTPVAPPAKIVVVVGAEGEPQYAGKFAAWAERWAVAAKSAAVSHAEIGRTPVAKLSDRDQLTQTLEAEPKDGDAELWIVLIGHGTADDRTAHFNLRGPDVSDDELARMLTPFRRPLVLIDCSASSAPFVKRLSGAGRVVVTATRSAGEENFSRFGDYFSGALTDPTADYDRDGQVSLLEAFLAGSRRTAEFYRTESRLATEHALLDDNGDGLGTPGDWFRGLRATKRAKDGAKLDGHRAAQIVLVRGEREKRIPADLRSERDRVELNVAELRDRKATFSDDEYYELLEPLLIQLADIQERIDQALSKAVE